MNVTLPDGTTIEGVPEGTTKEQLAQKLKSNGHEVPADWLKPAKPVESKPEETYGSIYKESMDQALHAGSPGGAFMAGLGGVEKTLHHLGSQAGEAALSAGQKMGLSPEVSAGVATLANVGLSEGPGLLVGGGAGAKVSEKVASGVEKLAKSGAEDLMQSAIKPTLRQLKSGEAASAIRTMLDEGITVSKGGYRKLRAKIDDLNEEIKDTIAKSTSTVSKSKVASYLDDLTQKLKNQVNPQSDLATVKKAFDDFMNHPQLAGKMDIPVQEAQKLKQGTYRALGDKSYGELKGTEIEAQKSLARGLKEEIAKAEPTIQGLNAKESKQLGALNVLERRVLMDANKNPAGLTLLAGDPKAMAAFMADRSALFKSLAAKMINAAAKRGGQIAGGGVGAGVTASSQLPLKQYREVSPN